MNVTSITLRNSTIALWVSISDIYPKSAGRYGQFDGRRSTSSIGAPRKAVTWAIHDFQQAVIHSMRQLISYGRVPDYLPNRSIRIPLTHDAVEVCRTKEVSDAWNR